MQAHAVYSEYHILICFQDIQIDTLLTKHQHYIKIRLYKMFLTSNSMHAHTSRVSAGIMGHISTM